VITTLVLFHYYACIYSRVYRGVKNVAVLGNAACRGVLFSSCTHVDHTSLRSALATMEAR
jgi:hypothetical protein